MFSRIASIVVGYLAQPVSGRTASTTDSTSLSTMLRPGDVLLSGGKTRAAALVRRVTRSPWAHVSMYVGPLEQGPDPLCVVEADVAGGVRAVPLSELSGQEVRVLRATFLRDEERRRLAEWMVSRIGDGYDVAQAWALAKRLLRLPSPVAAASGAINESARRFICSSLLAQAFLLVGYQILPTQIGASDASAADHRHVIPRDFEAASGFEVVS